MFRSLPNLFRGGRPAARRRRRSVRPGLDALEGRQLLTLFGASEVAGSDPYVSNRSSAVAIAPDGAKAMVWVQNYLASEMMFIRTEIPGQPTQSWEVAGTAGDTVLDSLRVAIDDAGYCAVTWRRYDLDYGTSDVYVARYDPSGDPLGRDQVVGDYGGGRTFMPDVAVDPDGNVGVSFVDDFNGNEYVEVQWFDPGGDTWYTHVDITDGAAYANTRIAESPDGTFVVGYDRTTPDIAGTWQLALAGFQNWSPTFSSLYASSEGAPTDFALSINGYDRIALAYVYTTDAGTSILWADRINSDGSVYDAVVLDYTSAAIWQPTIALADTDAFVAAFNTSSVLGEPWSAGVDLVEVSAGDSVSDYALFNPDTDGTSDPSLGVDADGNYTVTFTLDRGDGGQIWMQTGTLPPPIHLRLTGVPLRTTMYRF